MSLINDNSRPLIFIGSNSDLAFFTDQCGMHGIEIHGIIDSDYWGNRPEYEGIRIVDTEQAFEDPEKCNFYKQNYHFFLATNWQPDTPPVFQREREKRQRLIELIDHYDLPCLTLVDPSARINPSAKLGKNVFIDSFCYVGPKSVVGDFTNIYCMSGIGVNNQIGRNCVFQRHSGTMNNNIIEDQVYFGPHAHDSKGGLRIRRGTIIHPCLMIRRDTQENEVVSLAGTDLRKIYQYTKEAP